METSEEDNNGITKLSKLTEFFGIEKAGGIFLDRINMIKMIFKGRRPFQSIPLILSKEPRRKLRGIFGWPGYATRACVARVRERGIASAQEVTGI
jgi:hypothetical protein